MTAPLLRVARIGKQLWNELEDYEGELGWIRKIWSNGFLTVHEEGRVLYFFQTPSLHVPFGISLEGPLREWLVVSEASIGDILCIAGGQLYLASNRRHAFPLAPQATVDLQIDPPGTTMPPRFLISEIEAISTQITNRCTGEHRSGKIRGGDSLEALLDPYHDQIILAVAANDSKSLLKAFKELVGRGRGLTPSGDDLLVGFMCGWRAFCSPPLRDRFPLPISREFLSFAWSRTTSVSAELIRFAMRGCFSELLCALIAGFREPSASWEQTRRMEALLQWGHSSGRDTLKGLLLSLRSLLHSNTSH